MSKPPAVVVVGLSKKSTEAVKDCLKKAIEDELNPPKKARRSGFPKQVLVAAAGSGFAKGRSGFTKGR